MLTPYGSHFYTADEAIAMIPIYKCPACGASNRGMDSQFLRCHYCDACFMALPERIIAWILRIGR